MEKTRGQIERERRERFCLYYALGTPLLEAVERAGWLEDPACQAVLLLTDQRIRQKIEMLRDCLPARSPLQLARAGLERLALENPKLDLDGDGAPQPEMDLFHVAQIGRGKTGGVELRFFDRLRALELLAGLEDRAAPQTSALLDALSRSAGALEEDVEQDG